MAKSVKTIQFLNTGIFSATILFSCGYTYDELSKFLKRRKAEDWHLGISDASDIQLIKNSFAVGMERRICNNKTGDEKILYYLYIRDSFTFTDYEYCVLAHEIIHILQFMLPRLLDRNIEIEAEAYTHTHIMKQCLEHLRGK